MQSDRNIKAAAQDIETLQKSFTFCGVSLFAYLTLGGKRRLNTPRTTSTKDRLKGESKERHARPKSGRRDGGDIIPKARQQVRD